MPPASRFLLIWLLAFGVMLGGTAGLCWLADPYDLRRAAAAGPVPWKELSNRVAMAYQLLGARPDTLLIGTSRVGAGIDPGHPALAAPHERVFKATLPAASLAELAAYVQHAASDRALQRIALFVDFSSFYRSETMFAAVGARFDAARLLRADSHAGLQWHLAFPLRETLLTGAALRQSVRRVAEQASGSRLPALSCDRRVAFARADRAMTLRYLPLAVRADADALRARRYAYVRAQAERGYARNLRALGALLGAVAADDTAVQVIIEPIHARRLEAWHALGLWPRYEQWKRDLSATIERFSASNARIELWDFSDYGEPTLERADRCPGDDPQSIGYYESSHFTYVLGSMVLDRMVDEQHPSRPPKAFFGQRLTGSNIETHLARVRERRKHFVGHQGRGASSAR